MGNPTSPSWVLNRNYVTKGIKRFDCSSHEYGKRASSGIMIGYIINMEPKEILKEVNQYKKKYLSYIADITMAFNRKSIIFSDKQNFQRKNVTPNEFNLTHIWVDIRKNYQC